MELIVTAPFLTYVAGDLITDPAVIATLLPEYADFVVKISGAAGGNTETLTVVSVQAVAGAPCLVSGTVANSSLPDGLQWSGDGGASWAQATGFTLTLAGWSCFGPSYIATGPQPPLSLRDAASPAVVAAAPAFTVSAPPGVAAVAGLSGSISAQALKAALSIGIADVAGLGDAAGSNFGTLAGDVADGGALASLASELSALPAGALTVAGLSGTVTTEALKSALSIGITDVAGLGNAAASNFGTVAGSIADGGALAALANQTASIVPATSANVIASLGSGGLSQVPWADMSGSASVFAHGTVPAVPFARAGMHFGDREKLAAWFNFAETWDTQANYDAYPKLQAFLLYCQSMALAMKTTSLDSNCYRMSVTAYLPRGTYLVSQPLVVPEYVNLHTDGMIVRAPFTGDQSNNGTTSVPGAFYAASAGAQGQFEPTVIVAPRGHASRLNVYVGNENIDYRGSGVAIGKTWQAQSGAACTLGHAGTGYSVGDIVVLAQPSAGTYWPWTAQVTAVNASGGITAANVALTGAYGLPPALQQQQWTAANGFSVFDPLNAGCFLQTSAFHSDFVTPSPGTGATLAPGWAPDFIGGQYNIGAVIQTDTLIGHLNVTGFVPGIYSPTYGGTWGVLITGLNGIIDEIELLGGNDGVYCRFANDWRISTMNCVGSGCGLELYGCGSIECPNLVFDTCGAALLINQSDRIVLRGLAFFEQANISQAYAFPASLANDPTQGFSGYSAIQIGQASSAAYPNAHLDITMTLVNMGGLPATTITQYKGTAVGGQSPRDMPYSLALSYVFSSCFDIRISNIAETIGTATLLPSSGLVCFGQGVDGGNEVRGTIDGPAFVTGPAATLTSGHAWPGCGLRIWDAVANGYQGAGGTYELSGSGAPVNGTAGTGLGKAAKGSTYRDLSSPGLYIQTGAIASPSWLQIA